MAKVLTGRQRSEAKRQIVITNPNVCYYCKTTGLTEADNFCPNCGFPQRGTQGAMKKFMYNVRNKHTLLENQKKAIRKARNILFGLGILFGLLGILLGIVVENDLAMLLTNLIIAIIYLSLGMWSRSNPFAAILTGFLLYITLIVINAAIDPSTIVQGIFIKGAIIAGFIYGYKGVKESAVLEKELESIKKAKDLSIKDEVSEVSN